jgi:hypothetical protein
MKKNTHNVSNLSRDQQTTTSEHDGTYKYLRAERLMMNECKVTRSALRTSSKLLT